jgi:xanthine dehydrogenase molybdenum-binding subunit
VPDVARDAEFVVVGKDLPVRDAVEKVTGTLKYAVDFGVPGMAYGKILRSPHPHARILRIDTTKAEALPGVLAVVTHHDSPGLVWENAWFNYRGQVLDGTARFVGDDIAAVAATNPYLAEEAAELVEIEWELLEAVFDAEEARKPGAPQIRDEGNEREPYEVQWGDTAQGERDADVIVECDIRFESQQAASMGRNACVAEWTGDRLCVWTSTQTPSEVRDSIHEAFGIPLSKIRVQALPVGCSFGNWWVANFMLITVMLAKKCRRPVKIELTNSESMATVKRRHNEHTRGRMGCTADGRLTLAQIDHVIDNGGYGFKDDVGFFCVDLWGRAQNGHFAIHGVNTNRLTAGCMRAVGDVTLGSAVERLADMCAIRTGIDPVEFRLRNQIRPGEELRMQHSRRAMPNGSVEAYLAGIPESIRAGWPVPFRLSSGSTEDILTRGAAAFGWEQRWKGWGVPSVTDGPLRRAVGVGTGAHVCGVEFEGNTSAVVRINPDGSAKVHAAAGRQGQGSETTLTQVAAESLGIGYEKVDYELGDTDSCPWSHGSLASNTMYRIGFAVRAAALDARAQLLEIAGREFFGLPAAALTIKAGVVWGGGGGGRRRCRGAVRQRRGRSEPCQVGHPRAGVVDHGPILGGTDATLDDVRPSLRVRVRRGGGGCRNRRGPAGRLPGRAGQRDGGEPEGPEEPGHRRRPVRQWLRAVRAPGVRRSERGGHQRQLDGLQAVTGPRLPHRGPGDLR